MKISVLVALIAISAPLVAKSATVDYGSKVGSGFQFNNILEDSALSTFLGSGNPSTAPIPIVNSNSLVFANTRLGASASLGGPVLQSSTTSYSFTIKALPLNSIDSLAFDIAGTYNLTALGNPANALFDVTLPFNMTLVGANGSAFAGGSRSSSLTVTPVVPKQVLSTGGYVRESGTWSATWGGIGGTTDLKQIFNIPSMKVTELMITIDPTTLAYRSNDTSSATINLNTLTVNVIPEPSTGSLLLMGSLLALRRRRS